jgi:hypothetical protein
MAETGRSMELIPSPVVSVSNPVHVTIQLPTSGAGTVHH